MSSWRMILLSVRAGGVVGEVEVRDLKSTERKSAGLASKPVGAFPLVMVTETHSEYKGPLHCGSEVTGLADDSSAGHQFRVYPI